MSSVGRFHIAETHLATTTRQMGSQPVQEAEPIKSEMPKAPAQKQAHVLRVKATASSVEQNASSMAIPPTPAKGKATDVPPFNVPKAKTRSAMVTISQPNASTVAPIATPISSNAKPMVPLIEQKIKDMQPKKSIAAKGCGNGSGDNGKQARPGGKKNASAPNQNPSGTKQSPRGSNQSATEVSSAAANNMGPSNVNNLNASICATVSQENVVVTIFGQKMIESKKPEMKEKHEIKTMHPIVNDVPDDPLQVFLKSLEPKKVVAKIPTGSAFHPNQSVNFRDALLGGINKQEISKPRAEKKKEYPLPLGLPVSEEATAKKNVKLAKDTNDGKQDNSVADIDQEKSTTHIKQATDGKDQKPDIKPKNAQQKLKEKSRRSRTTFSWGLNGYHA